MDFFTVIRILGRRWHVLLSGLILTGVVAFTVMQAVQPTYEARGSALVVAPLPEESEDSSNPLSQNPLARFDASTTVLSAVTTQIMDDVVVRERLGERGANPEYQIGLATDSTPVLFVVVQDKDEERAIESVHIVLESINEELDQRQADAGAPLSSRIRSIILTAPSTASELVGARIRAFIVVAVLGVASSVSLVMLLEGFAQSRRRRSVALAADAALEGADDSGTEELARLEAHGAPHEPDAPDAPEEPDASADGGGGRAATATRGDPVRHR